MFSGTINHLLPRDPERKLPALQASIFARFKIAEILAYNDLADVAPTGELSAAIEDMLEHRELERVIDGFDLFARAGLGFYNLDDLWRNSFGSAAGDTLCLAERRNSRLA